jgi:hypothetical protein
MKTIHVQTAQQAFDLLAAAGPSPANTLGDLLILTDPPPKMWKALAVIATRAHAAYDECSGVAPGGLRDKCLFGSLAVRDFLVEIGYRDATVRSCFLYIDAVDQDDKQIWSVGLGAPGQHPVENKFNGHAVCTVPSLSLLIDMTVYQAIRPQWQDAVKGMAAVDYHEPWQRQLVHGCPSIAGAEVPMPDRTVRMLWLDRPEVNWKQQPDFRQKNDRRRYVTKALREAFGNWSE